MPIMKKLTILALLATTLASCDLAGLLEETLTIPDKSQLDQTVDHDTSEAKLTFKSLIAWTVELSEDNRYAATPDWLTLSAEAGGPGIHTLTMTLRPNSPAGDRRAHIRIIADDGDEYTWIDAYLTQRARPKWDGVGPRTVASFHYTLHRSVVTSGDTYECIYDAGGRLTEVKADVNENNWFRIDYTAGTMTDGLPMTDDGELLQWSFQRDGEGRITSIANVNNYLLWSLPDDQPYAITYEGGLLSTLYRGIEMDKPLPPKSFRATWSDGNLTEIEGGPEGYFYKDDIDGPWKYKAQPEDQQSHRMYYSDIPNNPNCNLDLNWILHGSFGGLSTLNELILTYAGAAGLYGTRSACMISGGSYSINGNFVSEFGISYTLDEYGYVKKAVIDLPPSPGGLPLQIEYEFTYLDEI